MLHLHEFLPGNVVLLPDGRVGRLSHVISHISGLVTIREPNRTRRRYFYELRSCPIDRSDVLVEHGFVYSEGCWRKSGDSFQIVIDLTDTLDYVFMCPDGIYGYELKIPVNGFHSVQNLWLSLTGSPMDFVGSETYFGKHVSQSGPKTPSGASS